MARCRQDAENAARSRRDAARALAATASPGDDDQDPDLTQVDTSPASSTQTPTRTPSTASAEHRDISANLYVKALDMPTLLRLSRHSH